MSANRLLFLCPESVIARYSAPDWWFEGTAPNRYLKIFVHPNEYKGSRNIEGGEPYIHSAAGVFAPPRTSHYSFTANIIYGQAAMLYFLEYLGIIAGTSGYNAHKPIVLRDYVRPEDGDGAYTVRMGRINSITETGGMITNPMDGKLYQHGFELNFIETYKRRAY